MSIQFDTDFTLRELTRQLPGRKAYDKIVYQIILAHLPVVTLFAPWGFGTYYFTAIACVIIGIAATLAYFKLAGTALFGVTAGVLLMSISAVLIQAQLGRIEMHFHIFGALALLLLYRDWRAIVVAAAFIAVHHLALTGLQLLEVSIGAMPVMVYNYGCSWGIAMLHAIFVVFESAFLVYYAQLMQRERAFSRQLSKALTDVQRHHDLTIRVTEDAANPATGAFNNLMREFEKLINELRGASDQLSETSTSLLSSSTETTTSAASQHEQVSHTVDAMAEMSTAIQDVARNAQEAAKVTQSADQEAKEGAAIVATAIETTKGLMASMNEANESIEVLNKSAQDIGSVVDVIRDISEQTNLLALNAAIEAARAGDQGRGFAVVSDEVRVLAQRTQKSTEEIQQIIESLQAVTDSVIRHINRGRDESAHTSEDIARAGTVLNSLSTAVSRISDMNNMNASSAEEQSVSAKVITDNIQVISDISTGSVANVESNQRTAEALQSVADSLKEKMKRYRAATGT